MTLTINGQTKKFATEALTLIGLLEHLGLAGKPVVIELNQQAVLPDQHRRTQLAHGDSVEIVTIAAGG
ncbi:MAG: sulfur carrier protein ThiS [Verrucomicrobiales bacterium]